MDLDKLLNDADKEAVEEVKDKPLKKTAKSPEEHAAKKEYTGVQLEKTLVAGIKKLGINIKDYVNEAVREKLTEEPGTYVTEVEVEKIVEKEVIKEVPVEVEKIVEVPKIIEKEPEAPKYSMSKYFRK